MSESITGLTDELKEDSAVYKTLLESTLAIPWKIDWKTMQFAYIGPQIEELLGWTPESWMTVEDWAARMHPDDRDYVVNFCVSQSKSGIDHEADYRALTKDGDYVWIRDVVHVVRRNGEVEALIGFMFDISERKALEQSLEKANAELKQSNAELKDALDAIKAIGGIIPVCAWCGHKIKSPEGNWIKVDEYIHRHTESEVTHGMCPSCQDGMMKKTEMRQAKKLQ